MTLLADTLQHPYRLIRKIDDPDDAPWPGRLVWLASGEGRMLVSTDVVGSQWLGWRADAASHVLAGIDLVRREDGHDIAFPICPHRVTAYLTQRIARRLPLTAGECVTLAVSVLRGLASLEDPGATTGEWWLTDTGRPVLATDTSIRPVPVTTAEIVGELARMQPAPSAWQIMARLAAGERVTELDIVEAETSLFAIAEPAPLAMTMPPAPHADSAAPVRDERTETADAAGEASFVSLLMSFGDGAWADALSRVTTAVWRRVRNPTASRRTPWILALAVAAAVITLGLMWPSSEDAQSPTDSPSQSSPSQTPDSKATEPTPISDGDDDADLADVVARLLDERTSAGATPATPADPAALGAGEREIVVLDVFGDVAVVRVSARDGSTSHLVTIARTDGKWLLRDVQDVAQQP